MISLVRRLTARSADRPARLPNLGAAPELRGVHPWLNTPGGAPPTLAGLSAHVVLVEFWTFACGNCQRTVPFLRRMHRRYGPELVVLGDVEISAAQPNPDAERS